ncbi:MAG: SIS domain-containing protein [Thermodesulfobacteriota bacterium]
MENSGTDSSPRTRTVEFARGYAQRLVQLLEAMDWDSVSRVIEVFLEARSRRSTIFFVGNGGSAATASHFANDMCVCASPQDRTPFRALSLTCNNSHLTCLANDFGYDTVFSLQLRNLMEPGDVVVGISASGNSPNVVNALEFADRNGGVSVALVGFDGGRMKEIARHCIHVRTDKGEYGPAEDMHMVLDHLISNYLASV